MTAPGRAPDFNPGVVAEGAADFFFGRPLDANPYSKEYARSGWDAWRFGWTEASWFNDMRGDEERARWWREAA